MSKIPIAKGGFRSYVSKNSDNPQGIEHNEQKFVDRIRNKENMSESDGQSTSSTHFSLKNPVPTEEDYARFDADRRFRDTARDVRVAARSGTSSTRSTMSPLQTTPSRVSGGSGDQYFTPSRNSGGGVEMGEDEQFVTPETSRRERRSSSRRRSEVMERSVDATLTPTSRNSVRNSMSSQQAYNDHLSHQLNHNFERMNDLIFNKKPPRPSRQDARAEETRNSPSSPRRLHRRTAEEMRDTILASRSSSQPLPERRDHWRPAAPRATSPLPNGAAKASTMQNPYLRTSYVDAVVATHQMHIHYADVTAPAVEGQMTKLENLRELAALTKPKDVVESKRRRLAAGSDTGEFTERANETEEQTIKKQLKIDELKKRILQIVEVQTATHKLLSKAPFERNPSDDRLLASLDHWMALPFRDFDKQTSKEQIFLTKKMRKTMDVFKEVTAMTKNKYLNRSLSSRRSSDVIRIQPSADHVYVNKSPPHRLIYPKQTKEAATQVTARLANEQMSQTSPRPMVIEKLDLGGLQSPHRQSPRVQQPPVNVVPEAVAAAEAPQQVPEAETTSRPNALPANISEINEMLNNIVLKKDESLDSLDSFRTEISFPPTPPSKKEESVEHNDEGKETPKTQRRASIDAESARRLSSGIAFYLKKHKRVLEDREDEESSTTSGEKIIITLQTPSDKSSSVGWSLADMDELNGDETQWEHEKEEEELRHLREVGAETPTREIKTEVEDRPATPEPVTPQFDKEVEVVTSEEEILKSEEDEEHEANVTVDSEKTISPAEQASESLESEGDETKKFVLQDEFEKTFEEEDEQDASALNKSDVPSGPPSYQETMNESINESADDSGFLLNNSPVKPLKSYFDKSSPPKARAAPPPRPPPPPPRPTAVVDPRSDTPRIQEEDPKPLGDVTNNSTFIEMDMDDYCQNEYLYEIAPILISKAIELQDKLLGVDWVEAQSVWHPPTLADLKMDYYDHFDSFEAFSMLIWGGVVDLLNEKYAKFGRRLTVDEEQEFEAQAMEFLKTEHGTESRGKEWCQQVQLSKKQEGMMPLELEYRFDVRRGLPDQEKKQYQWQQLRMKIITERYPRIELEDTLNEVYNEEKERLARSITTTEILPEEDTISETLSTSTSQSQEVGVTNV